MLLVLITFLSILYLKIKSVEYVNCFLECYYISNAESREQRVFSLFFSRNSQLLPGFLGIFIFHSNEGLTPPSTSLCRPKGLIFPDGMKEKTSGLSFSEGLTHPSLSLCRPKGLLAKSRGHLILLNPLNLLNPLTLSTL